MTDRCTVKMAFEPDVIELELDRLLPSKTLPPAIKESMKYQQIVSSVKEIGLVEAPVVTRLKGAKPKWLLLDGHVRVEILREIGHHSVACLVSLDDEGFTYNKRVNRLATVQEHKMILRAVERGVSEKVIARALGVNVSAIRQKQRLLDGICKEAEEMLKDRQCPINTFEALKKMKPLRQIEAVELMVAANNFSVPYAKALLASTPSDHLVEVKGSGPKKKATHEQLVRIEGEMSKLQSEIASLEETYGTDQLNLVLARGYIASLLDNERVANFLAKNYPEISSEFTSITEAV